MCTHTHSFSVDFLQVYSLSNGSNVAVSKLSVGFTEHDDGATLQCDAASAVMAAQEPRPRASLKLRVQCEYRPGSSVSTVQGPV